MPTTYNLAPIPIWQFTDDSGIYNVQGKLHTYRDIARQEEKLVYQDIGGTIPYPNPIILDGVGSVGPIYWASDENYFVELRDSTDTQIIWTVEHFNATGGGGSGPITTEVDYDNLILNGQFNEHYGDKIIKLPSSYLNVAANHWYFKKDNTTATDAIYISNLTQLESQTLESSPVKYFAYECSGAGSGEAQKILYSAVFDVHEYAGKEVTFSFVARSSTLSTLQIAVSQYFGSGGSSSVETPVASQVLTATWVKYSYTFTVPTIVGKIIGSGETYLSFIFNLPLNSTCSIHLTNVQVNLGSKILEYQYKTKQQEYSMAVSNLIPKFYPASSTNNTFQLENKCLAIGSQLADESDFDFLKWVHTPPIGSVMIWPFPYTYSMNGWYPCFGDAVITCTHYDYAQLCIANSHPYGVATVSNLYASALSGADVTFNNYTNGACEHMANATTSFTFTLIQNGDATHPEIRKITCTSGSTIKAGDYFTFGVPSGLLYYAHFVVNGEYRSPAVGGREEVVIFIEDSFSASQVAAAIYSAMSPLYVYAPDYRGYFLRGLDYPYTGRDPDAASRTGGNVVGSTQTDAIRSHPHPLTFNTSTYVSPLDPGGQGAVGNRDFNTTSSFPSSTGNYGGNETRALNKAINFIIKVR